MVLVQSAAAEEINAEFLGDLTVAAARLAQREYAVVYLFEPTEMAVLSCVGDFRIVADLATLETWRESVEDSDPLEFTTGKDLFPWSLSATADDQLPPTLTAVSLYPIGRVPNGARGVLILGSGIKRERLSAAQGYAIQSIVANLESTAPFGLLPEHGVGDRLMPAAERLRLLESVVVNARDSILITEAEPIDLPGPRIVYCNPAFEQTTGYSDKDVRGKTPRILHGAGTSRRSLDILKAALRAWQPVEVELLNYRKDGSEFWVELSIVPVADERGWFTHWVSVQRDITERKALEAASIRAREDEAEKRQLYLSLAERQRAHDALVHAATHDALTGLPNRTHLVTRVDDTLRSLAQSDVRHSAVLYLDLDGFKLINDSLGHAAGDALLREVSCRLRECISTRDTLARISGDEFVILVQEVLSRDLLEELAQRINSRLRHSLSGEFSGFYLSCSIGIVPILKVHQDAEDVLRDGDAAMYAAKRLGNGKFMFFQTQMRDQAIDSIHLQKDLHSAIANEAFEVHYQPIFNAQTRSIVGMEALVRWTHSIRGAVPPDTFIPVAERIGIVGMIDQLVRTRSFQQFCEWRARMPALRLQLNVNVSALELRDSDFLKNLEQLAIYSGFSLTNLQIELTEGVLLNESHTTLTLLRQIRERGVRVAFDDFGTGYSSLAYIASYEIDTIKIDRSFVTKMLGNPRTMAVLESIVYLAKRLELDVVAEGVETEEQLSALALMGCDFVQGYLLGKPIPAAALTERLAHAHRLVELHTLATGNSIGD